MTRYNPAITAQKTVVMGGVGSLGVVVEVVVNHFFPGMFPSGSITAASVTLYVTLMNWFKNK